MNSLQLDEPLMTPRTNRHPPSESGGNMYLHVSQRTSGVGAGPYSASRLERPQIFVIRPPSRPILFGTENIAPTRPSVAAVIV